MDSRERLTAASRGGETDRLPWFAWQPNAPETVVSEFAEKWSPDLVVVSSAIDASALSGSEAAILVEVGNPFGAAMLDGVDLNAEFEKGPELGGAAFEAYVSGTRSALAAALESGADGVLYRLFGAEPTLSTPMQFGGFYLEHERELLSTIADARFNVVFVEGGDGVYLDVVSDLPCHAFAWDEERSAIPATEVRAMHRGALACGLHSEDPQKLFSSLGRTGLILSGKVEDLATFDFSNAVSASQSLIGATR